MKYKTIDVTNRNLFNKNFNFYRPNKISFLSSYTSEKPLDVSESLFNDCKAKIGKRLRYLKSVLENDQDAEIFKFSKKTALRFVEYTKLLDYPKIGVDDTGYVGFEWHNYKDYDFIIMLFKSKDSATLTGIKDKKCLVKVSGIISEVGDIFKKLWIKKKILLFAIVSLHR